MLDVMIIGGGPAGMTAGLYASRMGLKAAVFEKLMTGGQASTTNIIENYPGFARGIGGPELMMEFQQQAEKAGCEVRYDDVLQLELNGDIKTAKTASGFIRARTAILCMGAQARKLGVLGEDRLRGRGVSYCATCDGAFYRGKSVAVVGGGNTAAEDALYLSQLCEHVYLIHRRDSLRADAALVNHLKEKSNIEIIWDSVVTQLNGYDTLETVTLRNVKTGSDATIAVAGVFVAVGQVPGSDLVRGMVDLDSAGYIIASEDTLTSLRGVYAAGDIRTKPLRQVVTAAADGAVAAAAAGNYLQMK